MKRIALIIVVAVFGTISSNAQITKVDQEVFGMDCAPCAYGLERGLKKMDGLEKVRVSLNDGKAYLELSENNSLSLKQIQEEVKRRFTQSLENKYHPDFLFRVSSFDSTGHLGLRSAYLPHLEQTPHLHLP